MAEDNDYEVGYKKPPKRTQFKPGQSGNAKGRPKGSKSIQVLIRDVLNEKIPVKTPRGPKSMTRLQAGLTQLANKAASGDFRAIKEAIRLSREIQDDQTINPPPQIIVNFVKPGELEE